MAEQAGYEPLLAGGAPEEEMEDGHATSNTAWRPASPFRAQDPDELLGEGEHPLTWAAFHNLDEFFSQVYRYWEEKGFVVILVARILNLAALAFTIFASGVLLLGVDYSAIHAECLKKETCNLWDVAVVKHPLAGPLTLWKGLSCIYLTIFAGYWAFAAAHLVQEIRGLAEVRHFFAEQVGMSERALRAATWPEVAARLVVAQRSVRLCISRDLTEHDIVSRIMRRENYLIGLLNNGVLALNVPVPGLHRHVLLTKTVEWNLRWCVLDPMLDDTTFKVRQSFVCDEAALQRRFRIMAIVNALFSPFLLVFLVIYFFMKNAEALYHHPSSIGARRWSPAARWSLREFNELPYFVAHRLNAGHGAAERYVAQFPNHAVSHCARFVAFVAGSFAAVLIALTLFDERLLERDLAGGRQLVWWLALLGVILAAARSLIVEPSTSSFDPGLALLEVAAHTHYLPRHWRGRAHTLEVQEEFQSLFRYRAFLFLEELASVLLTPVLLWYSLPRCAGAILAFIDKHSAYVDGVGDVCSLAVFRNFKQVERAGAAAGEGPSFVNGDTATRFGGGDTADGVSGGADVFNGGGARAGGGGGGGVATYRTEAKLEKSLVSFAAAYPTWSPPAEAQQFLSRVAEDGTAAVAVAAATATASDPFGLNEVDALGADLPGPLMASLVYNTNNTQFGGVGGTFGGTDPLLSLLTSRYPHFAKVYLQGANPMQGSNLRSNAGLDNFNNPQGGVGSLFASAEAVRGFPSTGDQHRMHSSLASLHSLHMSVGGMLAGGGGGKTLAPEDERILVGHALLQSFLDRHDVLEEQQQCVSVEFAQEAKNDFAFGGNRNNGGEGEEEWRKMERRWFSGGSGALPAMLDRRNGSLPRAVPAPAAPSPLLSPNNSNTKASSFGAATSIGGGGTPGSQRRSTGTSMPSPGGGVRSLPREISSELSVLSRNPSEVVEISRPPPQ